MNSSPNSIPENAQVIIALKESIVHGYVEKVKTTLSEGLPFFKLGTCEILGTPSEDDTPSD